MLGEKELGAIIVKAEQSMEQGDLDINLAASSLRVSAERFYYLLKYPAHRPIQQGMDRLLATLR